MACALPALAGCVSSKVTVNESPKLGEYRVQSVAILPFDALPTPQSTDTAAAEPSVPSGMVRSGVPIATPLDAERLDMSTVTVPAYAPEKVTRLVYKRLRTWTGIRIIPPDEAKGAVGAVQAGAGAGSDAIARQVAQRLTADAVLVGRVLVYKERDGSRFGGNPATVGFELRLIAADGTTLWVGNYYEHQRPMLEDFIGFVQRGGVFVTADELARYGVNHVLERFPFGVRPKRYEPEESS